MNIYEIITLILLVTDFIVFTILVGIPILTKLYCRYKGVTFSEYDALIDKYGGDDGIIESLKTCIRIAKSVKNKGGY